MRRSALFLVCWITAAGMALTAASPVAAAQAPAPAQPHAADPASLLPDSPLGRLGRSAPVGIHAGMDESASARTVSDRLSAPERDWRMMPRKHRLFRF